MINLDTIISAFNDKLTLLQWLKNVNKALVEGILKNVKVVRVDSGHVKIVFTFEDGTTQETNSIVLGEADLFTLATLIEGSESVVVEINESNTALEVHIDADVMRKINNSLQLPVARPNEQKVVGVDTSNAQTLLGIGEGLQIENDKIKVGGSGNINLNGDFTANSIIENMEGYTFTPNIDTTGLTIEYIYASIVKNGNKLTLAIFGNVTKTADFTGNSINFGTFNIPTSVGSKLYPYNVGNKTTLGVINISFATSAYIDGQKILPISLYKYGENYLSPYLYSPNELTNDTKYTFRYEITLLLSDSIYS